MATLHPAADAAVDGRPWHALPALDAARELRVETDVGLSGEEAARRLGEVGPNRLAESASEPRRRAFLRQYRNAMQLVLLAAGVGSLALGELSTGLVVLALTLFNAVLGLQWEGKAAAPVAALQKLPAQKARARRDGALQQIAADELVPGDVVLLEAGDAVPADGRLLESATLEIAETALTGERVPVSKFVDLVADDDAPLSDRTDMVYMSTSVTRGTGGFVVTATGMATEIGHSSRMLQRPDEPGTPLTRQLTRSASRLLAIAGLSLAASVVLDLSRGQTFETVLTSAIAFSIAAVPTALPAVMTAILSRGTRALAAADAIVRRKGSAEILGSTSAINCDATGMFTLNQLTAVELTLAGRRYTVSGSGYGTVGAIRHVAGDAELALEAFLLPMALASDAVVHDGELIGDPTEGALVVLAEKGGLDVQATRERYPRIAELPFDAAYKLMATFHRMSDESGKEVVRCFVKGAPDQLLGRALRVLGGEPRPTYVDNEFRRRYLGETTRLANQGLRVIATARRDFDLAEFDPEADLLPLVDRLTLLALVGIVDPPRTQAKAAIATARTAGIQVRMLTGDRAVTAEAIARELGIEGRAVTGAEFAAMSDERVLAELDGIGVIARVAPEHKLRVVDMLRRNGHTVAMTGDGAGDAPALQAADVGIAMGITGTEVAKEAATLILTDESFSTIVRAVEHGRELSDNLVSYVRFQIGVLAGMILTFLGASVLNIVGGMAFLPLQALYLTFTTQVSQAIGLGHGRPAEGLMQRRPRAVEEPIDHRWIAIVALLHATVTLGVMAIAEGAWDTETARTMGLVTFSLLNLLFSFTVRDERRSVFDLETLADRTFLICGAISFAAIVAGVQTRLFERMLDTVSLDFDQWLLCLTAALTIVAASEVRKALLRRAG